MATQIDQEFRYSLRCLAGWHRAEPVVHWNHGYYFTRCRRCGSDLVRTAYSRWQAPKGYRVVWSDERPPAAVGGDVTLLPEEAEGPVQGELPIQEVLRQLDEPVVEETAPETDDAPAATEVDRPSDPEPEAVQSTSEQPAPAPGLISVFPDFMDDTRPFEPIPSITHPNRANAGPDVARGPNRLMEAARGYGAAITGSAAALRGRVSGWIRPGENWLEAALILVLLVGTGAILFALAQYQPAPPPPSKTETAQSPQIVQAEPRETPSPPAEPAEAAPPAAESPDSPAPAADRPEDPETKLLPPAQPAYVAARLLNCRDAPSLRARTVRRLERGYPVDVYAVEQGWANIAHRRGQCWALADYLSIEAPL
jgi:hypothetical protein